MNVDSAIFFAYRWRYVLEVSQHIKSLTYFTTIKVCCLLYVCRQLNGMSNRYWGWGLEDDEFHARIKEAELRVHRPDLSTMGTGRQDTFAHNHSSRRKRRRDNAKCHNQLEHTRLRDRKTGLGDLESGRAPYHVRSVRRMQIDGRQMTLLNVQLVCDRSQTPWCDCTNAEPDKPKKFKRTQDSIVPVLPYRRKKT